MHHDPSTPLFLTYCARIAHYPIQAPVSYQQRPNIAAIDVPHRMVYHAQIEFLDEQVRPKPFFLKKMNFNFFNTKRFPRQIGNLTGLFKTRGMWEDTLMVLHSDNVKQRYFLDYLPRCPCR